MLKDCKSQQSPGPAPRSGACNGPYTQLLCVITTSHLSFTLLIIEPTQETTPQIHSMSSCKMQTPQEEGTWHLLRNTQQNARDEERGRRLYNDNKHLCTSRHPHWYQPNAPAFKENGNTRSTFRKCCTAIPPVSALQNN